MSSRCISPSSSWPASWEGRLVLGPRSGPERSGDPGQEYPPASRRDHLHSRSIGGLRPDTGTRSPPARRVPVPVHRGCAVLRVAACPVCHLGKRLCPLAVSHPPGGGGRCVRLRHRICDRSLRQRFRFHVHHHHPVRKPGAAHEGGDDLGGACRHHLRHSPLPADERDPDSSRRRDITNKVVPVSAAEPHPLPQFSPNRGIVRNPR